MSCLSITPKQIEADLVTTRGCFLLDSDIGPVYTLGDVNPKSDTFRQIQDFEMKHPDQKVIYCNGEVNTCSPLVARQKQSLCPVQHRVDLNPITLKALIVNGAEYRLELGKEDEDIKFYRIKPMTKAEITHQENNVYQYTLTENVVSAIKWPGPQTECVQTIVRDIASSENNNVSRYQIARDWGTTGATGETGSAEKLTCSVVGTDSEIIHLQDTTVYWKFLCSGGNSRQETQKYHSKYVQIGKPREPIQVVLERCRTMLGQEVLIPGCIVFNCTSTFDQ